MKTQDDRILVLDLAFAALSLSSSVTQMAAAAPFTNTGAMNSSRAYPTATLLPNSKVLVAGGNDSSYTASAAAELYDPATGSWTPTGTMSTARFQHTATLLPNGKVLVAGGDGDDPASAELYDPLTGRWTPTGQLNNRRHWHTATLLPNGRVLSTNASQRFYIIRSP